MFIHCPLPFAVRCHLVFIAMTQRRVRQARPYHHGQGSGGGVMGLDGKGITRIDQTIQEWNSFVNECRHPLVKELLDQLFNGLLKEPWPTLLETSSSNAR